jgi:hypothetical protein
MKRKFMKMKSMFALVALVLVALPLGSVSSLAQSNKSTIEVVNNNISVDEVIKAIDGWGAALIAISTEYEANGIEASRSLAEKVVDSAYGYNFGAVLFKPTLTNGEQTFRTNRRGAIAYFVGGDSLFPNDSGFAIKGWKKFEYKKAAIYINGDIALTMGNVMLTDSSGKVTTVDKTWAFKKDQHGKLRIVLHHSSLPYSP